MERPLRVELHTVSFPAFSRGTEQTENTFLCAYQKDRLRSLDLYLASNSVTRVLFSVAVSANAITAKIN